MAKKVEKQKWLYQAVVRQIKDGDTIAVDINLTSLSLLRETSSETELVDLGFSLLVSKEFLPLILAGSPMWKKEESIRFFGVNAPEKDTEAGKVSMQFVKEVLPVGLLITLETIRVKSKTKQEKYGRYLGRIILPDGRCLNDMLLEQNLAVPMLY
jgi:endonuclease YncB( thermonuclease family)